jgi:hypothetical protein
MKTRTSTRNGTASRTSSPTDAQIQARAYELYVQGGRRDGQDMEHWLRAEKELREQPVMLDLDAVTDVADKPPAFDPVAPPKIHPLEEREHQFARGKRGAASRDEIRTQQVHSAGRRSH